MPTGTGVCTVEGQGVDPSSATGWLFVIQCINNIAFLSYSTYDVYLSKFLLNVYAALITVFIMSHMS